jgi:hypothetical protein
MKATIISHSLPPDDSVVEIHRFGFELDDGTGSPITEIISLRTARVITSNLPDGNALIMMLRAIVAAKRGEYDSLVGSVYRDSKPDGGDIGFDARKYDSAG